ncbi:MAG: serine hydrolase domain-containing protein [Clostridia bacterium]
MVAGVRDRLEGQRVQHRIPGMAGMIGFPDGTVQTFGLGHCDLDRTRPVEPNTLFGIASLTKTFTAVAILQLAEAGMLHLDDRVADYFPAFAEVLPAAGSVRLIHLLSHASGLPDYSRAFNLQTKWNSYTPEQQARFRAEEHHIGPAMETVDDLLEAMRLESPEPIGSPGERFNYSNEGFALLGHVIERVSGLSYEAYLARHVFDVLEMNRSRVAVPDAAAEPVTHLFEPDAKGFPTRVPAWPQAPATLADGFVRTTVEDLYRYLVSFLEARPGQRRLLRASSRRNMATPRINIGPDSVTGPWYGLGWYLDRFHGARRMYHTGDMSGVASYMAVLPDHGAAVALLSNLTGGPAKAMGELLLEAAVYGGTGSL